MNWQPRPTRPHLNSPFTFSNKKQHANPAERVLSSIKAQTISRQEEKTSRIFRWCKTQWSLTHLRRGKRIINEEGSEMFIAETKLG